MFLGSGCIMALLAWLTVPSTVLSSFLAQLLPLAFNMLLYKYSSNTKAQ